MSGSLYPENVTRVSNGSTVVGRIVYVSDEVSQHGELNFFDFYIRGHGESCLSCSAVNQSNKFPFIRAFLGHVVEVTKMPIRLNKRKYLRFGKFSGRYVETSSVKPLPDDSTIGTDCPPPSR